MAEAVVSVLLSSLQQSLVDQFTVLGIKAERQISEIQQELKELERLKDLHAGSDYVRRHLASDIRNVSYRFENLLEAFMISKFGRAPDEEHRQRKCFLIILFRTVLVSPYMGRNLVEMANKVREIKRNFQDIIMPYHYDRLNPAEDLGSRYLAYGSYEFVGRVEEMKLVLSYLCSDSDQENASAKVISISGMGCVGKTALAQQLYEHHKVLHDYPLRAWVRVSPGKLERGKILAAILGQLERQGGQQLSSIENMVEEELVTKIFFYLERRDTLIVLDDIWSLDDWESLRVILPRINSESRSKILITTRNKQVAQNAHTSVHLRRLTDDEGCELLRKNIPDHLVDRMPDDLGKKIVNYCGGLPLTIVSFPQSMEMKRTLEQSEEMVTTRLNSAFSKRLETREVRTTLEVLASSYDDLPLIIQPIFLYMGVLQEDHRVEVEKLYLLSLADGLLKPLQRRERLVDIAQEYVTEVAQRSMVDLDEGEEPTITRFEYCQLNGLMRDLSLLKNKDERFFKVVDITRGSQPVPDSFFTLSGSSTCRAAIDLDEYEEGCCLPLDDDEMMHMRVLLFSAQKTQVWPREISSLVKFKYLRTLDFDGFNFDLTILPEGIATAVHLRYLSFKDCILRKLPASVGKLKLLCVLDLRVHHSTTMIIPNVLWKMKKLRHLYFPVLFEVEYGSKLRLDGLTELETITNFNARMFNVEDLFGLPNLQYLDSNVVGNLEKLECIIKRMTMNSDVDLLRTSVEIRNFDCYTEERHSAFRKLVACQSLTVLCMEGHVCRLPMYHKFSGNLTKIVFIGSELVEDPMRTLEKLPKLRVLVLDDAFVGKEIMCSASGFVELKVLKILNLQFLEKWIVENGAMPKLSTLAISNCGQLEMLPQGLQFVRGLRELKVSRMSRDFQNRIKVQHIPSIIFEE